MKIAIVTEYFYPTLGGITENIYHFSRELLRRGHDFRIITGFGGDPGDIDPEVKSRTIFVGKSVPIFFNGSCGRYTAGFGLTKKIRNIFREERFDIVHVHSPMFPTLPAIANIQASAPIVATFHTCTGGDLFYYRMYGGRTQKLADRMAGRIAVSECCARENRRYFDGRFDVIPNGVDVGWWQNAQKIKKYDDGRTNILFLGRPDKRNGLDTLIAAFRQVHAKYPDTRLLVVGDGPLRFHFEKIVSDEIRNAVEFTGASNGTRPSFLASADIFCFTPAIASFGVTILEGMSAGKAIVASDIEAFRSLVKNNESALLVPPKNANAMAAAIVKLVEDKYLRERLGRAAFSAVQMYDWSHVAKAQIDYYNEILGPETRDPRRET